MNDPLQNISLAGLAIGFVPVAVVLFIMYRWSQQTGTAIAPGGPSSPVEVQRSTE